MPKKQKAKLELLDPQQIEFFRWYTDPKSSTYGNAKQSAIKAGYSETYAESITYQADWVSETLGQESMLKKAEKNLDELLELNTTNNLKKGDEIVAQQDPQLIKIKADITKFVASRAGKGKWSEKQEIETKNLNVNIDITPKSQEIAKKYEEELRKEIEGVES